MKRSGWIERRSPMRRKPPRRRAREAIFDPYVHWLLASPNATCVVCGTVRNIQGSHVGSGGVGQKRGRACDMVRMCGPGGNDCHCQWGERRLYFDPAKGWDRDRRTAWAQRWRLKAWHDYLKDCGDAAFGLHAEEKACAIAIEGCIENLEHEQQENAA